jgi:hypothetical protein
LGRDAAALSPLPDFAVVAALGFDVGITALCLEVLVTGLTTATGFLTASGALSADLPLGAEILFAGLEVALDVCFGVGFTTFLTSFEERVFLALFTGALGADFAVGLVAGLDLEPVENLTDAPLDFAGFDLGITIRAVVNLSFLNAM